MSDKTILVIGTYDTKDEELNYMCERIRAQGGSVLSMMCLCWVIHLNRPISQSTM